MFKVIDNTLFKQGQMQHGYSVNILHITISPANGIYSAANLNIRVVTSALLSCNSVCRVHFDSCTFLSHGWRQNVQ